ncbi:hypothetical protein J5N97_004928 [Dioscorea zingiberensis]|uniref:Legumain prodomain domain-containing protein n=1 Tax=Dioscorea zingiberensis TaxID=325984 RepID=A0A9D5D8X1_9LILI|nr:hypothetical protein J5N97_004928 [Dioscorea zingiberensis]
MESRFDDTQSTNEVPRNLRDDSMNCRGDSKVGTKWAVLVAGSFGYENYRHQADVCHAYQILKRGGLKDENIIVFMYDDIAYNKENPRPGTIINQPDGSDVYKGVPKDYVGYAVNVLNFYAVLLGDKTGLTGGSGKVVDSGPEDYIFIYYTDHGSPGVLGMPTNPQIYADDLIAVLKRKHASNSYKSLVFYLEACDSGSIFEGLLPENINIYATTASNAAEDSFATYCPAGNGPSKYTTCLGDLYSVSWMEDSDQQNLCSETLKNQYMVVRERTSDGRTYKVGSHVMQYGDLQLRNEVLSLYFGSNPDYVDNSTFINDNPLPLISTSVNQRDADLLHFWHKFKMSPEGNERRLEAQKQFLDVLSHRLHIDNSIELILRLLSGYEKGLEMLNSVRPTGQPLVDDWDCLKSMVRLHRPSS